jgi:hypothetical protein
VRKAQPESNKTNENKAKNVFMLKRWIISFERMGQYAAEIAHW